MVLAEWKIFAHHVHLLPQLKLPFFGGLISLRDNILWTAQFEDLSPWDFYLWDYLKPKVYLDRPLTLAKVQANIERKSRAILCRILGRVMKNSLTDWSSAWKMVYICFIMAIFNFFIFIHCKLSLFRR